MATIKAQTLKGFRDFMPEEARKRQYVISRLRSVFESYGFEPLETPALEYEEVLLGKYGSEGDKLMYRFEDNGKRRVALRYDQTVPLARYIGQNYQTITFPFKRYQIQPVWRAENTQKGRYREFLQCDVDTAGALNPMSDAEIVALVAKAYEALGLNYKIKINNRDSFLDLLTVVQGSRKFGEEIEKIFAKELPITVDKLEKVGKDKVFQDIINDPNLNKELFAHQASIDLFKEFLNLEPAKIDELGRLQQFFLGGANWLEDLKNIGNKAIELGVPINKLYVVPTLARGLDYYTGLIIEVDVEDYKGGSVGGGGRYDNLIGVFAGKQIPAVGFAFGFDRIIEAMDQLKLFPAEISKATAKVLVTSLPEYEKNALELATKLRKEQINAELYLEPVKLEKQLKYADKKGIPYIAIIGSNEAKTNKIALKNLKTQQQQTLTIDSLVKLLKAKE